MKFYLEFDIDDATAKSYGDIAYLLRHVANAVVEQVDPEARVKKFSRRLRDSNGSEVGTWSIVDDIPSILTVADAKVLNDRLLALARRESGAM